MFTRPTQTPAWGCAIFAILAAAFCLLNAFGRVDAICVTAGCSLFSEFTIWGLSPWWFGVAAFSAMALLAALGRRRLALTLCAVALFLDLGFLFLMIFTAPCVPCLLVAAMFAFMFICLLKACSVTSIAATALLFTWAVLASPNIFAAINESLGAWAIYSSGKTNMQLFFSPSCPTCIETVTAFTSKGAEGIDYFPVLENDEDFDSIIKMHNALDNGTSFHIAFQRGIRPSANMPETTMTERLILRWNLFRNKTRLILLGMDRIPVLITNGIPRSLLGKGQTNTQQQSGSTFSPVHDSNFSGESSGTASGSPSAASPTSPSARSAATSSDTSSGTSSGDSFGDFSGGFAGCGAENETPCD